MAVYRLDDGHIGLPNFNCTLLRDTENKEKILVMVSPHDRNKTHPLSNVHRSFQYQKSDDRQKAMTRNPGRCVNHMQSIAVTCCWVVWLLGKNCGM